MRGGGHRDRLRDGVDAVGAAGGEDRREPLRPHLGAEVTGVQIHVLGALEVHLPGDRLGDDVAGRQLGQLVLSEHETGAGGVHEVGALAPHRFRHQRLLSLGVGAEKQDGRMELDEFEVGDLGARPQRERHPVARGDRRVGGGGEDLPHAAGGEHHGRGVDGADAVVLALAHDMQGDAFGTAFGIREQVQDQGVLDDAQGGGAHRLDEGAGDLGTRRVAPGVRDAATVVAALAGQRDRSRVGGVEVRAGVDQPAHGAGALGDQSAHRRLVAQPRTGDQGVVEVLLRGVPLAERRGDAALGPPGGAVVETGLGDDDGREARGGAAERGGETGHAGADHDDVRVDGPAGGGGGQPYSGHVSAPRVSGMLSIRRVAPTRAATARTASPTARSSGTSVKSAGSTSAT